MFLNHDRLAEASSHGHDRGARENTETKQERFHTSTSSTPANIPLARASHMTKARIKGDMKVDTASLVQSYKRVGTWRGEECWP